jgi:sulfoxide reductase heme-binding subunit YedZ
MRQNEGRRAYYTRSERSRQIRCYNIYMPKKSTFLSIFYLLYTLLIIILVFGMYQVLTNGSYSSQVYEWGATFGQLAVVSFIITLSPGMMIRFNLRSKWQGILMVLRRQWGILTYLLACVHLSFVRLGLVLNGTLHWYDIKELYELCGILGILLLTPLFLTSNDYSLRRLKASWFTLHKAVYGIVWILFLHVVLQEPGSIWAILLGVTGILEIGSFIYRWYKNRKPAVISSPQNQSSDNIPV